MKRSIIKGLMLALMITCLMGCKSENETSSEEDKPRKEQVVKEAYDVTNEEKQEQEVEEEKNDTANVENTEQNVIREEVPDEPAIKPQTQTAQTSQNVTTESKEETSNVSEMQRQEEPMQVQPVQEEIMQEEPMPETTVQNTQTVPTVLNATADDSVAIADLVLEYINSYRSEPAVKLPGLTTYAQYRSRQLIRNFAHNTFDERAAATELQYGTYIDPTLYGIEGEPYYEPGAREAIAKAGYAGSIDYVAKSISELVKNSSGHWAYVGSGEYQYIGVGITYESGMWYCDIAVARENTDNK